jgi:hypothetical protein
VKSGSKVIGLPEKKVEKHQEELKELKQRKG